MSVCFTRVVLKNYQHDEHLRVLLELRFRAGRCYLTMSQLMVVFMRVTSNLAGTISSPTVGAGVDGRNLIKSLRSTS